MRGTRLGMLFCVLLAACSDEGEDAAATAAADSTAVVESAEALREMLAPVRSVSMAEVEFGDLGTQRASHADVREYARVVATDHRALIQALDSVARSGGIALEETQVARDLSGSVRIAHSGLDGMQGGDFDLAFIRAEVESHRQLLDAMDQQVIPAASTPALQQFLGDTRAMVHAHLTRSRQLLAMLLGQTLDPAAGQAPAAPRPQTTPTPQTTPPPVQQQPPPDTIPARI